MLPLLLDYEDVADVLQVSTATVKRLVSSGDLPAVKVAGARRVRRVDVEAFVARLGGSPTFGGVEQMTAAPGELRHVSRKDNDQR
ncbi:MAG: helix-turn-helix domain-containing protein [Acidimicrobiales bacterium]